MNLKELLKPTSMKILLTLSIFFILPFPYFSELFCPIQALHISSSSSCLSLLPGIAIFGSIIFSTIKFVLIKDLGLYILAHIVSSHIVSSLIIWKYYKTWKKKI